MAAKQKSYFLIPNFDYEEEGPIALGNIITKAEDPVFTHLTSLTLAPPVTTAESATESAAESAAEPATEPATESATESANPNPQIFTSSEKWGHVKSKLREGKVGLLARFFHAIKINATVSHGDTSDLGYAMDTLETQYIVPSPDYVNKRMQAPEIQAYLATSTWKSVPVFMITGIKVAHGLVRWDKASQSTQGEAGAQFTAEPVGLPVGGGIHGGATSIRYEGTGAESIGNRVFAYQVRKITKRGGYFVQGEQSEGAFLNIDEATPAVSEEPVEFFIQDHDVTTEDIEDTDLEVSVIDEDGDPCLMVVL
jgi:hypothetical protein